MSSRATHWTRDMSSINLRAGFISGFSPGALERLGNPEIVKALDEQLPIAADALQKIHNVLRNVGQFTPGCAICGEDTKASVLCPRHYNGWWQHGKPRLDDWMDHISRKEHGCQDEDNPVPPPARGHIARRGPYKVRNAT